MNEQCSDKKVENITDEKEEELMNNDKMKEYE